MIAREDAKWPLKTSDISMGSFAHVHLNVTDVRCLLDRKFLIPRGFASVAALLVKGSAWSSFIFWRELGSALIFFNRRFICSIVVNSCLFESFSIKNTLFKGGPQCSTILGFWHNGLEWRDQDHRKEMLKIGWRPIERIRSNFGHRFWR